MCLPNSVLLTFYFLLIIKMQCLGLARNGLVNLADEICDCHSLEVVIICSGIFAITLKCFYASDCRVWIFPIMPLRRYRVGCVHRVIGNS